MAPADMTVVIKAEDFLSAHLEEMRSLCARMETAAASMGTPIAGEELEFATSTLRTTAPEMPLLGTAAAVVLAGAALAGSTTKRVTRRALLTFGFLRGRRGER